MFESSAHTYKGEVTSLAHMQPRVAVCKTMFFVSFDKKCCVTAANLSKCVIFYHLDELSHQTVYLDPVIRTRKTQSSITT